MRRTDRYLSDNQDNITLRQGSFPGPQGTSSIYMLHHTERAPLTELAAGGTSLTENPNQEAGLTRSLTGQGSVAPDANQSLRNSLLTAAGYSADLDLQRENNPLRHYLDFITDDTAVNRSEQLVTTYQPGESTEADKELLVSERNPELESSLSRYLPVFDEILGSSSATNDEEDEDDEDKDANMFVNFDLNEAIKELKEKEYLTPSVEDCTGPVFPGIPKTVDTAVSLASESRSSSSVYDAVPVANTDVTGVVTGVTGVDTDVTGGVSRVATQQVERQGGAQGVNGGSNALTEEINGVSNALTEEIKGVSNALTEENKGGRNVLTEEIKGESNVLTDLEEENISGDELFKSGSEMTQAMESLTLAVNKSSTPVGEEKAGTSDPLNVNVNFPIPPMCAPSRGDETILRAQTADLRIAYPKNSNEPTAMIHRPIASTLDIRLPRWNTNTNAGFPADQSTFIAGLSPVSRTLPSSTARQLPPTAEDISRNILKQESDLTKVRPTYPSFYANPSAMDTLTGNFRQANPPNQSQQQNYPYSFQTERTSQGIMQNLSPYSVSSSSSGQGSSTPTMRSPADSTRQENPSFDPSHSEYENLFRDDSASEHHSAATAFHLGSESSSDREESYKLTNLTNRNSASSDASVRQFEDDTRSFRTSTPIRKPVKAKQQKDAMNEMLKSYKAQQGITSGHGSDVLNPISDSPDPSAHSSPQEQRRPLHLDVSGNVAPTQRGSQVHHVQSAPVIGQPPLYGDHHRVSKVPKSATPPKEIKRWPSKSPSSASASASPSTRSQFDQQDQAFGE